MVLIDSGSLRDRPPLTSGFQRTLERLGVSMVLIDSGSLRARPPLTSGFQRTLERRGVSLVLIDSGSLRDRPPLTSGFQRALERLGGQHGPSRLRIVAGPATRTPLGSSVRWNDWAVSMVLLDSGSLRDRPPAHLWVPASAGTTGGSA